MAEQQVWLGSVGPFLYDDAAFFAVRTSGQLRVDTAPTLGTHVLRRDDLATSAWPVGSVFIAVVSTNPGTLLGFGTWVAFGTGRVLVGIDTGDTDFDTVEETGGAKTVAAAGTNATIAATATSAVQRTDTGLDTAAQSHTHPAPAFTGSPTSVVQPYIVVYMWKRTA